jgi:hypothetical protein
LDGCHVCRPLRLPWDIQALIIEETISLAQVEAHTRFVVGNEGKKDDGHWVVYENLRLVSKDWKVRSPFPSL